MIALDIIKRFEGCHKARAGGLLEAYLCPARVWTCGWGSTGSDVTASTIWHQGEADARLEAEAARCEADALRLSPILSSRRGALDAIVSFIYNLGAGNYAASTLRRAVNSADWTEAGRQIRRWNKAGGRVLAGLTLRREAEAQLIERG